MWVLCSSDRHNCSYHDSSIAFRSRPLTAAMCRESDPPTNLSLTDGVTAVLADIATGRNRAADTVVDEVRCSGASCGTVSSVVMDGRRNVCDGV